MDQSFNNLDGMEAETLAEEKSLKRICACDLPEPDAVGEGRDLPRHPPPSEPTSKGIVGAIIRTLQQVPTCVWVVNQHSEEITVVVARYKPDRLLSGIGVNASVTGAGLDFTTTTFVGPATKKTLRPRDEDQEGSMAVFPLWTRKDGFGVVTIFKGPEKALYIENDRIPLGATVYFANKPNLRVMKYGGALLPTEV